MKAGIIFLFILCFASFIWGMGYFFKSTKKKPTAMRVMSFLGAIFLVWQLLEIVRMKSQSNVLIYIGFTFYLTSLTLFWWAVKETHPSRLTIAYSPDTPSFIYQSGPYKYIRHPFYLSYSLCWAAGIFSTSNFYLLSSFLVMAFLYYKAAIYEEAKFSASKLANEYENYKRHTGAIFPKHL
jgi:protein-S-isoprenylcysteine O-methyltransferase Ste14